MLHNDIPSRRELEALASLQGPTCVSIYTPTEEGLDAPDAHRVAFGNQVRDALDRVENADDRALLAEGLDDLADDDPFWRYQSRTLVVLATGDHVHVHRVANRLEASETVSDRYYLKPLLRAFSFPQNAFVLALSEGAVRLVEIGAEGPARSVDVADIPVSAADHAGKTSLSGRAPKGRIQGTEGRKLRVRQYARAVDQALRSVLTGRDVPLILAAAQPVESIFRSVNSYPGLLAEGIEGNPEELSDEELAAAARGVLDGHHADELARFHDLYSRRKAQGRAQSDLADIARSATYGLVDTLFIDIDGFVPGTIEEHSGALEYQDGTSRAGYDVVDEVARRALLQGARVLAVRSGEVPDGSQSAAVLRYLP